jgi:hypothetical protein
MPDVSYDSNLAGLGIEISAFASALSDESSELDFGFSFEISIMSSFLT